MTSPKNIAGVVALVGAGIACSQAVVARKLETDKDKFSYTVGQQIADNIKSQSVDVDPNVVASSLKDGLEGKKSELSREEMTASMSKAREAAQQKMMAGAGDNLKKGEAWLEENKKKPGIKVTAGGLQYKVITEGKGAMPKGEDTVTAHYKGTLIDGTEFDSSYKRGQPADFPVRGVIPGWTEALQTMKVGEKRELFIPAKLGYGERGMPPSIPPNSVLVFEVELLNVAKAGKAATKPKK